MTTRIRRLFGNFRLPSLSGMIADVEKLYIDSAESPAERETRRREIAAGRFRYSEW